MTVLLGSHAPLILPSCFCFKVIGILNIFPCVTRLHKALLTLPCFSSRHLCMRDSPSTWAPSLSLVPLVLFSFLCSGSALCEPALSSCWRGWAEGLSPSGVAVSLSCSIYSFIRNWKSVRSCLVPYHCENAFHNPSL